MAQSPCKGLDLGLYESPQAGPSSRGSGGSLSSRAPALNSCMALTFPVSLEKKLNQ